MTPERTVVAEKAPVAKTTASEDEQKAKTTSNADGAGENPEEVSSEGYILAAGEPTVPRKICHLCSSYTCYRKDGSHVCIG